MSTSMVSTHRYGKPKNLDEVPERPPIIFVSQHGKPGEYHPLARPAKPASEADAISHQRSTPIGTAPDLPRGATSANGHGGADPDPDPDDEGEEELVVVRG
jgi:hypothetical protein